MLNRSIWVVVWVVCAKSAYAMEDAGSLLRSRMALMGRTAQGFEPAGGSPYDDDAPLPGPGGGMYGLGTGPTFSSPMLGGGFGMYGGGQLYRQSNPGNLRFSYPFYDPSKLSEKDRKALAMKERARLLTPQTPREQAVSAILGKGTLKRAKLNGHHWELPPAQISVAGDRVLFEGSLFHTGWFSSWHELDYQVMFISGRPIFQIHVSDQVNYMALVLRPLLYIAKIAIEYKLLDDFKYSKIENDRAMAAHRWEDQLAEAKGEPITNRAGRMEATRDLELRAFDKTLKFQKRKEYVEVGMQVLNAGVDSYQRLNNERFSRIPDWERQAYLLVYNLIPAAWERVFLMGIEFEALPVLFEDPDRDVPIDFQRAFHPKGKADGYLKDFLEEPAAQFPPNHLLANAGE